MGEQTWNSRVGCLPPACEFWFAWICNSLIFPFFGSSCLWASGKLILGFLLKAPLVVLVTEVDHTASAPGWGRSGHRPCVVRGDQPQGPPAFQGRLLPLTVCLGFSGVFLFFRLCSSTHWITQERILNLTLPTRCVYTNVKWATATFGQRWSESLPWSLDQSVLKTCFVKYIGNTVLNMYVRYKEQHESICLATEMKT